MTLTDKLKSIGRKYVTPALLCGIALGNYGCSPSINDGVVVYKEHRPVSCYTKYDGMILSKKHIYVREEDYILVIGKLYDGEEQADFFSDRILYVTKDDYDRLKLGDKFDVPKEHYKFDRTDVKLTPENIGKYFTPINNCK